MTYKKIGLIVAGAVMVFAIAARLYWRDQNRLNILIVSVCSMRTDVLNDLIASAPPESELGRFAAGAVSFDSAYNSYSWSNVGGYLSSMDASVLKSNGYHAIGHPWPEAVQRAQNIDLKNTPTFLIRAGADFEKNYGHKDLEELSAAIRNRATWPFIVEFHTKRLHLPYAKLRWPFPDDLALRELAPEQREYLGEYFKHPGKYPERLPLLLYLGDPQDRAPPMALVYDPEINNHWMKSKYFDRDLKIIKDLYRARLKLFITGYLSKILNGFGDQELVNRTVIIFMGDHGEAFGEHGIMAHGNATYDEMLNFPLYVKFPGAHDGEIIHEQFYQGTVTKIVEAIMTGKLSKDRIRDYAVGASGNDYIVARNCESSQFAVRFRNEWKFIADLQTGERRLYHLTADPGEKTNVILEHPDESARLEEYWLAHQDLGASNHMLDGCRE